MIGHTHQAVSAPLDYRIRIVNRGLVFGVLLDISIDLFTRKSRRIERMSGRHGLIARKGPVFVQQIPAATVDQQQPLQFRIGGSPVKMRAFRIALPPVNVIQILRGLHKLTDQLELAGAEARRMKRHLHRLPFGQESIQGCVGSGLGEAHKR